jgi:membrane-bound serine protease (ClpP class)
MTAMKNYQKPALAAIMMIMNCLPMMAQGDGGTAALNGGLLLLASPVMQILLIMIMIGGIYTEMHTPGIGFPAAVAIVAAVLFFLPLYVEGFAAGWEITAFAAGLILLALEIFVVPGFGVTGASGMMLIFASLFFAQLPNDAINLDNISSQNIYMALLIIIIGIVLGVLAIVLILKKVVKRKGIISETALNKEQKLEDGYIGVPMDLAEYVGMTGTSVTVLRPAGKISIGDKLIDAVSTGNFIEQGTRVKVVKYENTQLYVTPE